MRGVAGGRLAFACFATGIALLACTGVNDLDLRLRVALTASASEAAVGESVTFGFDATGRALIGVIVDYGDGAVDSVETYGATSARGGVAHAYDDPGEFIVEATAVDAIDGEAVDQVTIVVQP